MTNPVPHPAVIPATTSTAAGQIFRGMVAGLVASGEHDDNRPWDELPGDAQQMWEGLAAEITTHMLAAIDPKLLRTEHYISVTEDSWALQHPLACRPNLAPCPIHDKVSNDDGVTWDIEPGSEVVVKLAGCGCLVIPTGAACEHGSTFDDSDRTTS